MKTAPTYLLSSLSALALATSVGCSSDPTGEGNGQGDGDSTENTGGQLASGGTGTGGAGSGGLGSGGAGTGGLGTGGDSTTGGAPGTGGMDNGTGGGTGGDEGTGGMDNGTGGEMAGGGEPVPSDGCGTANPPTGSSNNPLSAGKPYYVKLPNGYDPETPYKLIFVFNPTGNPITWAENSAGYEQVASDAIRVYPHENPNDLSTSPGGWGADDVSAFPTLYDAVMGDYCVDTSRVFAVGESSGGDYVSILGCEHGDKLRGVGPCATKNVPQYQLNVDQRDCVGDVTAIVIHGLNDSVVGSANGPATRDFYVDVNECSDSSEPVTGYTDTMSNCVMYTGCKEGFPVYWCQHQDPNYGGTQHGWPGFAAEMTWEVFSAY